MKSETYNGYSNYETWAVALWLGNEESSYRYWRATAREEQRRAPGCRQVREDVWPADKAAKYRLADRLKEYKAKHAMRQQLLSDFKREVSRAYGVLLEDRFFSRRAYFLIDREGILRWSHVETELGHKRDDAELLRQIAAL